ncbi:hypothetical protein LQG66_09660 [Bradyrhizobium ontarionense]|uniref:NAD(+)--protein-arginine ADP-ribosyltransferase n=1 Tax=Bradyrhizobium ontarionense TaxID=2898149 RepID=A0ABY3RGE7_9BRAD|nr:ADP-ribosyltransferase domain-containing protein [Bradyrhizobium sp. A19]UFZ06535.1 hypothetical protein LQG66_09660 [Bradyrhizobium sp. A19]
MAISHPIDGDLRREGVFVQFLGNWHTYIDCCSRARLVDGIDPAGLSAGDRLAIWIYTTEHSRWYQQINSELWSGHPSTAVREFARILNGALQKLPVHIGAVHRGYMSDDLSKDLAKYTAGAIVDWPGFTSTSRDEDKALDGNMTFTILSRSGRVLGGYSDMPSEDEILFHAATKYRVLLVQRQNDDAVVELEEVIAPEHAA